MSHDMNKWKCLQWFVILLKEGRHFLIQTAGELQLKERLSKTEQDEHVNAIVRNWAIAVDTSN